MAQVFNSYESIRLYVAICDSPIQNLLFQTVGDADSFTLVGFEFEILDHQVTDDIVIYALTYGDSPARFGNRFGQTVRARVKSGFRSLCVGQ